VSDSRISSLSSSSRFCVSFLNSFFDDLEIDRGRIHADDIIALGEVHAVDAACLAAHGADFRFAEENRPGRRAGEEHHVLAVGELGADQLIVFFQADGDDAGGARVGEFGELGFLYGAVFGGEENVTAGFFQVGARGRPP